MDKNKFSTIVFYISIFIFIVAFNFADNPASGWYQQFMPFLNNAPLSDVIFVDSLVGYAVTGNGEVSSDTNYVVKTTNGGDNWNIIQTLYTDLTKVKFLDENTGFVCGGSYGSSGKLYKTTNGGINWFLLTTPFGKHFEDMCMFNVDTIWITDNIGPGGGIFRTNNGGLNWVLQFNDLGGNRPLRIYMINSQVGFFCSNFYLNKTSDGGFNWTLIPGQNEFSDMYFLDTLVGWKALGSIEKTTDGGFNWMEQVLPPEGTPVLQTGTIFISSIISFSNVNKDTIWGVGSEVLFGTGPQTRGLIYKTTDGGENWGFQLPDTSINIFRYFHCDFNNKFNGWGYGGSPKGIHTLTGGDTLTYYTGINSIASNVPEVFELYQNYPNPFNPNTNIKFELRISGKVSLKVFDIQGKELETLINKNESPGFYNIEFNGNNLTSGIYFYRLQTEDKKGHLYTETKKMIILK